MRREQKHLIPLLKRLLVKLFDSNIRIYTSYDVIVGIILGSSSWMIWSIKRISYFPCHIDTLYVQTAEQLIVLN